MITSKSHAYLQTMTKTPVKFRNRWHKTVRVAHTRYLLLWGGGGVGGGVGRTEEKTEGRNAEYYVPEKAGDNFPFVI